MSQYASSSLPSDSCEGAYRPTSEFGVSKCIVLSTCSRQTLSRRRQLYELRTRQTLGPESPRLVVHPKQRSLHSGPKTRFPKESSGRGRDARGEYARVPRTRSSACMPRQNTGRGTTSCSRSRANSNLRAPSPCRRRSRAGPANAGAACRA